MTRNINRRPPTKPASSTASAKKTGAKKAKNRLPYDTAFEVVQVLHNLPAFTFVLLGAGAMHDSGPTLASVVELIDCFATDSEYKGPAPESLFGDDLAKAKERCEDIIKKVQEQIAKLRQSGETFVLLWHAYGDTEAHFEHSEDNTDWYDIVERLAWHIHSKLMLFAL